MASFRTGFKIIGEISLKQGLGRIRSFSEDRKPGQWLPEDQWAVRQPGSTCPEPCDKPPKPAKPSKSWLNICKDPEPPIECDIRHSNCPSPPPKPDCPWYSLDKLIPKKKQEKPPPLSSCREEMKRREICGEEEEVCENLVDKTFVVDIKPEHPENCTKPEPCPAPVVTLSVPLPKELDLMLWCGRPSKNTSRIAAKCQSDKLPYQEFRPRKTWKTPPFSIPVKGDPSPFNNPSNFTGSVPYSEFKQVDVPRPLYTRYKSVELCDSNFMMCMVDVKCPDNEDPCSLAITPPPPPPPPPSCCNEPPPPVEVDKTKEMCPEKPTIEAASCKPVRIKKAPKYKFRPKPTKLIERRVYKNPCAQHKSCDLNLRTPDQEEENDCTPPKSSSDDEPPKVLTGTLTDEPQTYERDFPLSSDPPSWMYVLCKPGSKETPLVPACEDIPKEPDWCSETDGLKFYDGEDESISPKPPSDPCLAEDDGKQAMEAAPVCPEAAVEEVPEPNPSPECKDRFVLMPEQYCIKYKRDEAPLDSEEDKDNLDEENLEEEEECKDQTEDQESETSKVQAESKSKDEAESKSKDQEDCESTDQVESVLKDKAESKSKAQAESKSKAQAESKSKDQGKRKSKDRAKSKSKDKKGKKPKEEKSSFEKFIEAKTKPQKKSPKSYPPIKENILYDLQRLCPNAPFDPSKLKSPCLKPPEPDCPRPPRFYRSFSTLTPSVFRNLNSLNLCKTQRRTECGDSSGKCKPRASLFKPKECPEKKKPADCAEITLPCCPKARIPPSCNVRRPMPPCKKKLAPKPSFSECSKDPPPCLRMTECNCWEKKPGKNGRK